MDEVEKKICYLNEDDVFNDDDSVAVVADVDVVFACAMSRIFFFINSFSLVVLLFI